RSDSIRWDDPAPEHVAGRPHFSKNATRSSRIVSGCPPGTFSSSGAGTTVELDQKFRELVEQSNRLWILGPERHHVDRERTLAEVLGPSILTLTGHRLCRGSESSAPTDVRWAGGLMHE